VSTVGINEAINRCYVRYQSAEHRTSAAWIL